MRISRQKLPRYLAIAIAVLSGLVILFTLTNAFFNAIAMSLYNDYFGANGPFQLYNPLRRMADGQVIGADFQFFHGVLVPLLHYPFFVLFGGHSIFASEMSRWLMSPLLTILCSGVFFYALLRNIKWALLGTTLTLIAYIATLTDVTMPTNSLLSIRTTGPLFVAAAILLTHNRLFTFRKWTINLGRIIPGIAVAAAITLGTEHGLSIGVAYGLALCVLAFLDRKIRLRQAIMDIVWYGATIGVALIVLLTIFTLGHPLTPLIYGLKDIPADQSWYFGTSPNGHLGWSNIFGLFSNDYFQKVLVYAPIAIGLIVFAAWRRMINHIQAAVLAALFAYGFIVFAIGTVGGYFEFSQLFGAMRVCLVIIIGLGILVAINIYRTNPLPKRFKYRTYLRPVLLAAGVLLCFVLTDHVISNIRQTTGYSMVALTKEMFKARHATDSDIAGNTEWGNRLKAFGPYINQKDATVWSLYANMYESSAGKFNPSKDGFDYVIHALGPDYREAYERQFLADKPDYVITTRQYYFPYEEWLWQRHYPIYKQLLTNYKVVKSNSSHYLWQYVGGNNNATGKAIAIKPQKDGSFKLPAGNPEEVDYYEVTATYSVKTPGPVKKIPRYTLAVSDSSLNYDIALPAYKHSWTFLMPSVHNGRQPVFTPTVSGFTFGKDALQVTELTVRPVKTVNKTNNEPFEAAAKRYDGLAPIHP